MGSSQYVGVDFCAVVGAGDAGGDAVEEGVDGSLFFFESVKRRKWEVFNRKMMGADRGG